MKLLIPLSIFMFFATGCRSSNPEPGFLAFELRFNSPSNAKQITDEMFGVPGSSQPTLTLSDRSPVTGEETIITVYRDEGARSEVIDAIHAILKKRGLKKWNLRVINSAGKEVESYP